MKVEGFVTGSRNPIRRPPEGSSGQSEFINNKKGNTMKANDIYSAFQDAKIDKNVLWEACMSAKEFISNPTVKEALQLVRAIVLKNGIVPGFEPGEFMPVGFETDLKLQQPVTKRTDAWATIHTFSTVTMGYRTVGKFKEIGRGYGKAWHDLIDTSNYDHNREQRMSLISKCGFNAKGISILSDKSFASIKEIKKFIHCDEEFKNVLNEKMDRLDEFQKENNLKNKTSPAASDKIKQLLLNEDYTRLRKSAQVTQIETKIGIYNKLQSGAVAVKVYVCQHKDYLKESKIPNDYGATTPKQLYKALLTTENLENTNFLYRILKSAEVFRRDFDPQTNKKGIDEINEENIFKFDCEVHPRVDITKLDVFKRNIDLITTIPVILGPTDKLHLTLVRNFKYGLDLAQMSQLNSNSAAFGEFLIIDYQGIQTRIQKEGDEFYDIEGLMPCCLSYSVKSRIEYIFKDSKKDRPSYVSYEEKDKWGYNPWAGTEFQFEKAQAISWIPYEKINLFGNEPNKEWKLMIDNATVLPNGSLLNQMRTYYEQTGKPLDAVGAVYNRAVNQNLKENGKEYDFPNSFNETNPEE